MKLYIEIFLTFLKLGAFSFGGGYAMIPLIEREVCINKKWIEREKLYDVFAISEALPGAIALNASAFVGYTIAGVPGAIAALLGNLVPSVLIVWVLIASFVQFKDNMNVQNAFNGIRPAIIALITFASYKIAKSGIKDFVTPFIFIGAFVSCLFYNLPPIPVIVSAATIGIVVKSFNNKSSKKDSGVQL